VTSGTAPLLQVVAGAPTADELAAVVVALLATAAAPAPDPGRPVRTAPWVHHDGWVAPTSWTGPHR
jgi:hypothetical protein